jgi:hypothetical protein
MEWRDNGPCKLFTSYTLSESSVMVGDECGVADWIFCEEYKWEKFNGMLYFVSLLYCVAVSISLLVF